METNQSFFCNHCGKENALTRVKEEEISKRVDIPCYNCKKINHILIDKRQIQDVKKKSSVGTIITWIIIIIIVGYFYGNESTPSNVILPESTVPAPQISVTEPTYVNTGPWEKKLCTQIEPTEPAIRDRAVSIAREAAGSWNIGQLVDLFIWTKANINYVNDPNGQDYYAKATETLSVGAGDCDDQAILIASFIRSVGGTSRLIVVPECQHAFAAVFLSPNENDAQELIDSIYKIYYDKYSLQITGKVSTYKDSSGYWLIVDPAGGQYLGDLLLECKASSFTPLNC